MKILSIALFSMAVASFGYAQNPDKALTKVSYNFSHIQDTTQKDRPYKENMLLLVGKNASVYTSYDKINQTLAKKKQLEEQLKNQAGSSNVTINITGTSYKPTSSTDYFFFAKEKKFFTKERVINYYLIEEPAPQINWKISKDTTSFSGINCQKATAYFKGRNWTAWYATELPFQSGPWKLNGLPGLIIEAYDDTKTVSFQFAGMENAVAQIAEPTNTSATAEPAVAINGSSIAVIAAGVNTGATSPYLGNEIKLPVEILKATRPEFNRLKDAYEKDPQGFMKTQMAGTTSMITVTGVAIKPTGPTLPKIVLNNPLELPERK
ncbi:MAG: GLPGLI family protein [Flavobacterium sp.]|nr:MAG: GLPGLI family protein [Flavobacterium sp.]